MVLIEFITEIGKKSKLCTFWGWEVQIQTTTMTIIVILTYKRMTQHTHTTSIRHQKLRVTCRDLPSPCAAQRNKRQLLTTSVTFVVIKHFS